MSQGTDAIPLERLVSERLRGLRIGAGWSLDELARRTSISPSTLSRLETGKRRLTVDDLSTLARAHRTTVDALLREQREEDVVIHPREDRVGGSTVWLYATPDDTSGRVVARMLLPERDTLPEPRVHPGRDWFYVLGGTVRLKLGRREILVRAGQAASFETTTPHTLGGHGGPAEILSIFDHQGEQAHLSD